MIDEKNPSIQTPRTNRLNRRRRPLLHHHRHQQTIQPNQPSNHPTTNPTQTPSKMKLSLTSLPLVSLLALLASASPAANPEAAALLQARDVCGAGHEAYTRRIGSPCAASNGVHEFCSCDRTNIVRL